MGMGFQCFDSNGNTTFDTSYAPGRFIGSVNTNSMQGSINVPEFSNGTPFFVISGANGSVLSTTSNSYPLTVSISGTTLSWKYMSSSGNGAGTSIDGAIIVYGYSP